MATTAIKAITVDDQGRDVEVYWNGKIYGKTVYLTVTHVKSFAKSARGEQIVVKDEGDSLIFKSNLSADMDQRCYDAVKAAYGPIFE